MLGVVLSTGLTWALGLAAFALADGLIGLFVARTERAWWTASRKRSAVVALTGVNLLVGLVALAVLLEASAAVTAVTGALGAAALTQWNQRVLADRVAQDRRDERREAADQRSEDREEDAQRRAEDRAEAAVVRAEERLERRAEWVRKRRFAAYERFLQAQITLEHAITDVELAPQGDRRADALLGAAARTEELRAALAMVRAYGTDRMQQVAFRGPRGSFVTDPVAFKEELAEHHSAVAQVAVDELAVLESGE